MLLVAELLVFTLFCTLSSAADLWGFNQCTFDPRPTPGFKCKSGLCIDIQNWRDQSCDCCGPDKNCTSCTDHSDEECTANQIACDFGKCVGGSAATKNLSCQWDCIQTDLYSAQPQLYTECTTKRTPISGTMEELFTYCKRILSHTPMDCADNCCQPCLNQTIAYCNSHQFLEIHDEAGAVTQPGKQPPCVLSCSGKMVKKNK